jgi:hypothetical protein
MNGYPADDAERLVLARDAHKAQYGKNVPRISTQISGALSGTVNCR